MSQWANVYRASIFATSSLAGELDRNAGRTVPATPSWTVQNLIAHLAGAPADALVGRMDGAPGPAWTAQHVSERSGLGIGALLHEIEGNIDAVAASFAGNDRPALVWDAVVHHADLTEALGHPRPSASSWTPVLEAVRSRLDEYGEAFASVDDYELFRGVFSRRSRRQMAAWATGLGQEELDRIPIFGARDDDQP